MRRKMAVAVGVLILAAATGGAAAAAATVNDSPGSSPHTVAAAPRHTPRPLLAVVGASFSAGVGADGRDHAWPEDLARLEHWRLLVSADPGAGYVNPGAGHRGPFADLAARLHLARLDPDTIIIQGGHDDIGCPSAEIRSRVESLIGVVHREAPHARLAVLTVFPRGRPTPAARATDQTIVAAARRADPAVLVFDPIASHWRFPRIGDHLHPTPVGHEWIAHQLAKGLNARANLERAGSPGQPDRAGGSHPGSRLNVQPGPDLH